MANKYLNFDGLSHLIDKLKASIAKKVDKVEGKQLSTNDYTTAEKHKLAGIEENATNTVNLVSAQINDNEISYTKDVPEKSAPYAVVNTVGGMTRKCTNLIPFPYVSLSKTEAGMTILVNSDGSITVNGTATANVFFDLAHTYSLNNVLNVGEQYFMSDGVNRLDGYVRVLDTDGKGYYNTSFVLNKSAYPQLRISNGATFNNVTFYPMLNKGTEPLPYEPYFEGLRSAPVTEVESVGANLIPYPYSSDSATFNGVTFTINDDGGISVKGTAEKSCYFTIAKDIKLTKGEIYTVSGTKDGVRCRLDNSNGSTPSGTFTESDENIYRYHVIVIAGSTVDTKVYPMLNKGSTALPYTPYVRNTLAIPDEVKALDGYGWGINESVFNYIDWEKKQFVKRVEKITLNGSEKWTMSNQAGILQAKTPLLQKAGDTKVGVVVSNGYGFLHWYNSEFPKPYFRIVPNGTDLWIEATLEQFANVEEWRAYLTANPPVDVFYPLAEPIITDISDIITSDNLIPVEGGGTVTMVNEYEYDVPNGVSFYASDSSNETIAVKSVVGDLVGHASSAERLESNEGSETQPVYFKDGKPVATTYTLGKSVPSDAKFTDTVYTHPTHTAKANGFYKVTVDDKGHVSGTSAVSKADITALGIPAQDTVYTLPSAGTSLGGVKSGGDVTISDGVITVKDDSHNHTIANVDGLQTALDDKETAGAAATALTNANSHTDEEIETVTELLEEGLATKANASDLTSHVNDKSNPHGVTLSQLGVTATAAELNKMDGVTATTAELNYVDGVTSNIQTQLNAKAASSSLTSHTGNKSNPHGVTAAQVGLGNVNNTADADKPVSTAQSSAISTAKEEAVASANDYTDGKIADLINSAPSTLDTLGEIATAMEENADVVEALNEAIGTKANVSDIPDVINNLTSTATTDALSAYQGKVLNDKISTINTSLASKGSGDMLKSVYDTDGDGIVDNAEKVNGFTVGVNVPANAKFTDTVYTHPTYTAKSSGLYKVTVDGTGHVSGTAAVAKSDITALGIPAQDTTYSVATTSANGLMSSTDKSKLDGIASGANNYSLPTASSSTLGGVKTTSTVTSTSGFTACPIISGVPYYKDTDTTYTLSSFGITATAAELNKLDGVTATATELNYVDGVTSNIQTQINALITRIAALESKVATLEASVGFSTNESDM